MRVVHRKTAITCNQQPIAADVPAIILGIKHLLPEPTKEKPELSFRFLDTTLSLDALPGASAIAKAAFVSTRLSALKCDGKVSIIRKGCLARCLYALTFGHW